MTEIKIYPIILLMTALSLCVAILGSYFSTGTWSEILLFNQVPFYMSYQEMGFFRRGLVGSFVYLFSLRSPTGLIAISYGMIVIAALVFWSWVIHYQKRSPQAHWYYFVYLASPALFMHYGYDLGRYDALNLIIAIAALYLVTKERYLMAGTVSCLAILNHESFLFAFLPLILALTFYQTAKNQTKSYVYNLALAGSPALIVDVVITAFGGKNVDMDNVDRLLDRYINAGGVQYYIVNFTSIKFNIVSSFNNFIGSFRLNLYHLSLLTAYTCIFYTLIIRTFTFEKNSKEHILIAACFAPLLLMLISIDKGRWFSMVIFNLCLVFSYLHRQTPQCYRPPLKRNIAAVILAGLIAGPMTVSGFDFAQVFDQHFMQSRADRLKERGLL